MGGLLVKLLKQFSTRKNWCFNIFDGFTNFIEETVSFCNLQFFEKYLPLHDGQLTSLKIVMVLPYLRMT